MISLEEYLASALRGALRNGIDSELLVQRLAQGARQRIQEEQNEEFRCAYEAEMRYVPTLYFDDCAPQYLDSRKGQV